MLSENARLLKALYESKLCEANDGIDILNDDDGLFFYNVPVYRSETTEAFGQKKLEGYAAFRELIKEKFIDGSNGSYRYFSDAYRFKETANKSAMNELLAIGFPKSETEGLENYADFVKILKWAKSL